MRVMEQQVSALIDGAAEHSLHFRHNVNTCSLYHMHIICERLPFVCNCPGTTTITSTRLLVNLELAKRERESIATHSNIGFAQW